MTERDAFETRVQAGLRRMADGAVGSVDAAEITRQASSTKRASGWGVVAGTPFALWLVVLALAALAVGVVVVGGLLARPNELARITRPSEQPAVVAPAGSPSPTPSSMDTASEWVVPPEHQVNDVAFDTDGTIWVATARGILHWDPTAARSIEPTAYSQLEGLGGTSVEQVWIAPDGTVWAAGLGWLATFSGTWRAMTELGGRELTEFQRLGPAPDGTLWGVDLTSEVASLARYDNAWQSVAELPADASFAYMDGITPDGTVWLDTDQGILAYDRRRWTTYTSSTSGLPGTPRSPTIAADGSLWVSMPREQCTATACAIPAHGVARYDGATWTVYTTADGLADNEAFPATGPDGSIWLEYHDPGLQRVSRLEGDRWVTYDLGEPASVVAVDDQGALWVATASDIARFDGRSMTRTWPDVTLSAELPPLTATARGDPLVTTTGLGTITWQWYDLPDDGFLASLTSTPHGFVARNASGLRWSADGTAWEGLALSIDVGGVAAGGSDLYAYGRGLVRLTWDGARWVEAGRLAMEGGPGFIDQLVAGPAGMVMVGDGRIFYARNGQRFSMAEQTVESLEGVAAGSCGSGWSATGFWGGWELQAVEGGFIFLTDGDPSTQPACEPVVWFSTDGRIWERQSTASPFGDNAYLMDVAMWNRRLVAVGGGAWISDDGRAWQRLDRPRAGDTVAGGGSGWASLGGGVWVSADGLTWEPVDGISKLTWAWAPPSLAVGERAIVAYGNTSGLLVGKVEP